MAITAIDELTQYKTDQVVALAQAQTELAVLTDMWAQAAKSADVAGYQARIAAADACITQINAWKTAGKTTVYLFYDGNGMPSVSCNMNIG
jgi:hypothetical protein